MSNSIFLRLLVVVFVGLTPIKAAATDPVSSDETPQWWLMRSMETSQSDSAMYYVSTAISLDPQYAEAYTQRGKIFGEQGLYKRALKDFDKAIKYAPDFVNAYLEKAKAFQALGQSRKAIKCLDKALQLNLSVPEVFLLRSKINFGMGDLQAVVHDYSALIALCPTSQKAYLQRAQIYYKLGEPEKGNFDSQMARKIGKIDEVGHRFSRIARDNASLVSLLEILNEGTKNMIVNN